MSFREHMDRIVTETIREVMPSHAVKKALENHDFGNGKIILIGIGKASWEMAKAAQEVLDEKISRGIVITKYEHAKSALKGIKVREAGHPVSDHNSFEATVEAIEMVQNLTKQDTVLFLVSGGGSALFESPLVEASVLLDINKQLLNCGADIIEMNTIRKRLSSVKGGRFAALCAPANIYSIILSDIIGDPLDMIASGPCALDKSTALEAIAIVEKYRLKLSESALALLRRDLPEQIDNVENIVIGSVNQLCQSASRICKTLGYEPYVLTDRLTCQAREAGAFFASIAQYHAGCKTPKAFIAGGETVVKILGTGKGGRNQEMALSVAQGIEGIQNVAFFSVGSDGTDGPTDAAGGFVTGETNLLLKRLSIDIYNVLENNDAYHALKSVDGLIVTGPTGTNVNDFSVLLIG